MDEVSTSDHRNAGAPDELHLLATFRTRSEALGAERQLHDAGLDPRLVRVGSERDREVALRAETVGGSGYPKEAAKGAVAVGIPATIVGAVIALPFGLLDFAGLPLWMRLLTMAVVGGLFGGTIGFIAGPALTVERRAEPTAAGRGVPLRVAADDDRARSLLAGLDPIRLDRIRADDETHHDTIATDADLSLDRRLGDEETAT